MERLFELAGSRAPAFSKQAQHVFHEEKAGLQLQSCCQGLGSVCEIDVDREGLAGIDTLHPSRRRRRVFGRAGYGFQGGPAR